MTRDNSPFDEDGDEAEAEETLTKTADAWRAGLEGTEAEDSADEVARGADQAAEQPGYGREGS